MLQPRKHVGKVTCKSPRDHRVWKAPSSKGLCEIEEIDKEEVSTKMMQSLERFMRANPAVWSESSVPHLLAEIADSQYAPSGNNEAEERLHTLIMRLVVPMATIMEAEQESMKVERQKMQDATLALQRVQEECHHALVDLTKHHNRSTRDLEELGKALEENRVAAEEAGRKLTEKEKQIHLMLQKQRELVIRLVCGGPSEFVKWAREEIQSQGLSDLDKELEHSWWLITRVPDHGNEEKMPAPECSTTFSTQYVNTDGEKNPSYGAPVISVRELSMKLPCLLVSETFRQMGESLESVRGPFSLPFAVAGFWKGLAVRMACLAMVTLFPEVMQKIATTSELGQSPPNQV